MTSQVNKIQYIDILGYFSFFSVVRSSDFGRKFNDRYYLYLKPIEADPFSTRWFIRFLFN